MRRGIAVMVAASMMVLGAAPGLADDRNERAPVLEVDPATDRVADRPAADAGDLPAEADRVTDRAVDRVTDRVVDRVTDRAVDRVTDRVVDRVTDRTVDRVTDRETDRFRCVDFVTDRRCIDDRHPHVNIRHLIQRLINAGEWEKLFRLLHRLGII